MERSQVTESVEILLQELYEKKRWLDMMIGGLEAAVSSPEHRLIESVEKVFNGGSRMASRADLQRERRAALAMLARTVNSTPGARRRRSLSRGQAAST